ncbi:MAG: L-threonylcarbamoyladenylate synthase [Patescibacteria group bacterium]
MNIFHKFTVKAQKIISKGGVGVILTDTIYGIVCSALSKKSVNRVYRLRKRNPNKPVIVLIGKLGDLKLFGIKPDSKTTNILGRLWPGPVSVILPCASSKFSYLHRGKKTIAFRLPSAPALRRFLGKTGPLIAPSANFEGKTPAKTVKEAQKYFGNKIGFYMDGGKIKSKPSTLVSIKDGKISIIRKGAGYKK